MSYSNVAREELSLILRTVFQYWLLINLSLCQKISNFSLFSTNQPVQQLRLPLFNVEKFYSVVFDEIVSIEFDLPEQVKWTLILSENTNVLLGPFIYNLNCESYPHTLKVRTTLFLHHKIHHFVICGQSIKLAAHFLSHLFHCLLSARSVRKHLCTSNYLLINTMWRSVYKLDFV